MNTYEWTDNMPYVYLDVLKQVSPITGNSTCAYNNGAEHNFVILGSCDYLYYGGTYDTIADVKAAHESRHKLCWKFERQPMFLYCHADDVDTMTDVFSNADMSLSYFIELLAQVNFFAIISPLYLIVTMAETDKSIDITRSEYFGLVIKEHKTPEDYRRLLMFSIEADSESEYERVYKELSSAVSASLEKELVESVNSAYSKFSDWYHSLEDPSLQHNHYFANALAFRYMELPEKIKKDFIEDVYHRIWHKVQEILQKIVHNGICNKYTIDVYQQSKLQAFWNFNQSEKVIKENIEEWITAQNRKVCANEKKELFREIFADMFAVTVLGLDEAQYFDLINEFADITPPLVSNPINLLRIYAVSEVSFENNCLMRWLESGRCKYSNFNIAQAKLILRYTTALPLKEYIIQYAQSCQTSLQKKVEQKENQSRIEHIRNIFSMVDIEKSISALWRFWWRSMVS